MTNLHQATFASLPMMNHEAFPLDRIEISLVFVFVLVWQCKSTIDCSESSMKMLYRIYMLT